MMRLLIIVIIIALCILGVVDAVNLKTIYCSL